MYLDIYHMNNNNKARPGNQPPENPRDDFASDLEHFDKLLNHGIERLNRIELDEFTKGLTEEEIAEKLDSKGISIERSEYSQARKRGILHLENDLQFIVGTKEQTIDDIAPDDVDLIKEVTTMQLIARTSVDETNPLQFEMLIKKYSPEFQKSAGVTATVKDASTLEIHAARNGKVVLIGDMIYVVSINRNAECKISISETRLEARADFSAAKGQGKPLTLSGVYDQLDIAGIVKGINRKLIDEMVTQVNNDGKTASGVVIAEGKLPVHGKSARLIFTREDQPDDEPLYKILPDGRIDYRKQAAINMVDTGFHIATLTDPEPGTDGYSVTGEILKAQEGAVDIVFEGENVRRDKSGKKFYAECSGMLSFFDKVLSVFPIYKVDGNVDLKSGNITFNGSVIVTGNVRNGFEVKTTGDIIVMGSVEGATLVAGRDITVNGAIVGYGSSPVKAGRNILARHVQNASLEAQGDISIDRSVMHSTILTSGKLIITDREGSIVGGKINAMRGLEAMSVGSTLGTHTEVIIGNDYLLQRKKSDILAMCSFYRENLAKIDMILRPLMDLVKKGIPLGSEKKRRLSSIVDKRKQIDMQIKLMNARLAEISAIDPSATETSAIIQKNFYQGVTIKIAEIVFVNRNDLREVKLSLSKDRKEIELKKLNFVKFK